MRLGSAEERETVIEFLRLINASTSTRGLIQAATTFFQQRSGCSAVGVRLKEGDDYPYFEARGFPAAFLATENHLCARDVEEAVLRDGSGNPVLECMCGNVICGRFDPTKPFFTANGSFWTNSTSGLLARTTEADRQGRTRNRCQGEGYESVALIPLRLGPERFGLLQLNDHKSGAFSLQTIRLWERLADQLAVALAKFRSDEALRANEARLRSLLKELQEQGELLSAMSRMARIGGWEFDVATGRGTWTDEVARIHDLDPGVETNLQIGLSFFHGKWREQIEAAVRDAVQFGQPYDLELEMVTAKGNRKWVRTIGQPVRQGERIVRVQGTIQDVTERRQAEAEVRRLNEELEQRVKDRTAELQAANRELEAFSYSVSHDLRAPLRAIDGFVSILVEDYARQLDDEARRVLDVVRQGAARMGQLIDDLLTFSRAGRGELRAQEIEMTALAREVFAECLAPAGNRRIELKLDTLLPARGDRSLLRQVLANLFSNAIKYTKHRADARIEVGSRPDGAQNVYWVKDNGAGFDPAYTDRLFGIFQRLHSEAEFEGTGVGLALVQRIIRRHGGRVWAEGKLNEGAAFYFTLPADETAI